MKLLTLLQHIAHQPHNLTDREVEALAFDSRQVKPGTLFVAQRGTQTDGHNYIAKAIELGATAVVCETLPDRLNDSVAYLQVADSNVALGMIADAFYGHPSRQLKLVGITGTNGKTTTVTLLHRLFRLKGCHVGLLSTIVNKIDDQEVPSTHTTPDAIALNALLAQMVEAGCQYAFMEVSSHAIVQERIAGLTFAGGIFSNITHDHLDFHKTMAAYIEAKKMFFDRLPKEAFAITNKDDRNGMVMVQNTRARVVTYSLREMADLRCRIEGSSFQGLSLRFNAPEWRINHQVETLLVGKFNAYNLSAILATALLLGVDSQQALVLLSQLEAAEGRFEYVSGKGITAIVDYAHTPDALENVISTINDIRQTYQSLIVVVGCGGDRDPLKRPIMARIAAEHSNRLILTSDNPRTEDPDSILDAMEAGLTAAQKAATVRIADRRSAIKTACLVAKEGDIILVAGKGHEKYQDINGVKHHFDDKEELEALLSPNQ